MVIFFGDVPSSMPGLIENNTTSHTFEDCSAKSKRRSVSPRHGDDGDEDKRTPAGSSGVNDEVIPDGSFRVVCVSSCDLGKRDCCSRDVDSGKAENIDQLLSGRATEGNFEVRDLVSGYSTDSEDMASSVSSCDRQSHISRSCLDEFSLAETLDHDDSDLKTRGVLEDCPRKCLDVVDGSDKDSPEILRCRRYELSCESSRDIIGHGMYENDHHVLDEHKDNLVDQMKIVVSSTDSKRSLAVLPIRDIVLTSSLPSRTDEIKNVSEPEEKIEEHGLKDFQSVSEQTDIDTKLSPQSRSSSHTPTEEGEPCVVSLPEPSVCSDSSTVGQTVEVNQAQTQENSSNHRQRSLEPEPSGVTRSTNKGTNSLMQRSKSFPQVTQRVIFVPIRPSPEQSGLFPPSSLPTVTPADTSTPDSGVTDSSHFPMPSTVKEDPSKHTKQHSRPPVARVNPQTNSSSSYIHQHHDHQLKLQKNLHQRAFCPQMFAESPGYVLQDSTFCYQEGSIPVISVPGGYYILQDFHADMYTPDKYPVPLHQQLNRTHQSPADVLPFENRNCRSYNQMQETPRNFQTKICNQKTGKDTPSHNSSVDTHATDDMQELSRPTSFRARDSGFPQNKSSANRPGSNQPYLRRKYKKPLLPDPSIPKFSDLVAPAFKAAPPSRCFDPALGSQPYQDQHQYYVQSLGNNPSVFHVSSFSSPSFLQQVPMSPLAVPTSAMMSLTPPPFVRSFNCQGQTANGCPSSVAEAPDCSNPLPLGYMIDHTGLTVYGFQPPSRDTASSSPKSPAGMDQSQASQPSSEIQQNQSFQGVTQAQGQQPQASMQDQQPSGGILYLQDNQNSYTVLGGASVQPHLESVPYHVRQNQEVPGTYLVTSPALPGVGDDAERQQAAGTNLLNCPATVRMVSSNGPPVPMPMQVPPGHMVQQIVDENGILTHVILSSQPTGPAAGMPLGPYGGPGTGSHYYTTYGDPHYAPGPPQYPHHPHPHPVPPHLHGGMPHPSSTAPVSCTNHVPLQSQGEYGVSPPLNSTDDRTLRTRNRVRKKLQRRINLNDSFYHNTSRPMGGRRTRIMGMNDELGLHVEQSHCLTPENGPLDVEEERLLIIQCLSSLMLPKVTDVESRSSLIQLSAPDFDSIEVDLDPCEVRYELLLSDKGRDAKYKTVFRGDASEITLTDLKPATEYHLKVCAYLTEELKGALTEPVSFQTLICEPEPPQPPRLMSKTKTSLSLKWNATCENGSKVTTYILECDQGHGDGRFCEVYSGLQRQFRITRLNSSTSYMFRLAAINSLGKSAFSEEVSFFTSGSVPSQPDPPMLSEQFVYALTISWIRRPNDDEFLLQMEDESTGHGFITVYNGSNLSYMLRSLQRNTEYRFRLCAKNEEGQSKWSEMVCYRTQPERPQPPCKPQIKGKINPYSFHITWDPPQDSGGTEITKYIVELDDGQGYDTVYEGSERDHLFEHLTPGHVYHVRVACCSVGGRSEFSDCCVATTLPVAPSQCQVPKLQGKPKATSLHLRWGYPDYDGGAQVTTFAAQMISPDNTAREVYKGHDRDCIVTGLLPGRPYLFQVRAFNRAGAGPWSEPLEVVSGAGVPDGPKAPHVMCRSAHSALVTWDEPLNNGAKITEYRLEWQPRLDSEFSQLYVGPNQSFDVKGLTPATMYTFRVQALSSAGPGPYSSCTSCVTPPSSPSPIISVRTKANATSLLLTWHEPSSNGSDITSYNIVVNDKTPITVEPTTEYLLEDLLPETTYKLRVQAINGIGVGPYSAVVKCTTKALPPSPPTIECVLLAPTSIKLKWGEGRNSDLLTYTLEMEKEDGTFQPVYAGPAHMHKVTRLTEMTSYEFRIFASNDAGNGPYSDTYTFTTTKSPPPPLKAPKVRNITSHGCLLEWQGVKPLGGDSMMYLLQLLCLNGRDLEYKQIYKGPSTQYQLDSLQSSTEYQVRVAAVRLSSDGSGDITGAFSPGTIFSPPTLEPQRSAHSPNTRGEDRTEERKPWSDQQYAAIILALFVLLAVVSAFLCQQLISYMSGVEDPSSSSLPSSSSSASPPSSSHSTGGGGFS